MSSDAEPVDADVVIIGGGPAGLTAAIYLSRFLLKTIVIDRGGSRASLIPLSRNHAGYPHGIPGAELVARMRWQAEGHGTRVIDAEVTRLTAVENGFVAVAGPAYRSRAVLIATGVRNRRPVMDDQVHDAAVAAGLLRYCPVCDGYEIIDREIGVIGTGAHGTDEALFLRSFTPHVTLVAPDGSHDLQPEQRARLAEIGIRVIDGPARDYRIVGERMVLTAAGKRVEFDSVYPALGSDIHSTLATMVGAKTATEGCIVVDSHQRTSVLGLYAAGDVVIGLDQISHAMGEGGVAATTIRNDLNARAPLLR